MMPHSPTLATALLSTAPGVHLETVAVGPEQITATLITTELRSPCPLCGRLSAQIHSHYQRTLADLPWGHCAVRLHLRVRKFFCRTQDCPRRIFTERVPTVVAPYARRT